MFALEAILPSPWQQGCVRMSVELLTLIQYVQVVILSI